MQEEETTFQTKAKRLKFTTPEKNKIRVTFSRYIAGHDESPRPNSKNLRPIAKAFGTLDGLKTPKRVQKLRETVYNYKNLYMKSKKKLPLRDT